MADALNRYKAKRDFTITPEPAEGGDAGIGGLSFVIQKHWASRLHYDFRLELDGTMKSWAVPKGPSFDTHDKRMAVQVEDHPIAYSSFEGTIPEKQYGAGKVIIWDKGVWRPLQDPHQGYANGNLKFEIHGHKMRGKWVLVRMKGRGEKQEPWLLIKEKDEFARPAQEFSVVDDMPDSVKALPMPALAVPDEGASAASLDGEPGGGRGAPTGTTAPRRGKAKSASDYGRGKGSSSASKAQPGAAAGKAKAPSSASKAKSAATAVTAGKAEVASSRDGRESLIAGLGRVALPATLTPQLATLADAAPAASDEWIYEVKFDGYRILTRVDGKQVQLFTRNGHDWTERLLPLHAALSRMKLPPGWYDGEIVVNDHQGRPDFGALQLAFDEAATAQIQYFLFDLPFFDGVDLRHVPLEGRRELLQATLERVPSPSVRFSAPLAAPPQDILAAACQLGLEGVIGKRRGSPYVSRRSADWIKLKCGQRQEFIIGGYTDPQGSRSGVDALLLGVHDDDGTLRYAGRVGTGFDQATLRHLAQRLGKLAVTRRPFVAAAGIAGKPHWVRPQLLAEVSFAAWTSAGIVRHAVFHGLREDKPAKAITREVASHVEDDVAETKTAPRARKGKPKPAHDAIKTVGVHATAPADGTKDPVQGRPPGGLKISNADRLIDAESGVTKMDLVRYFALVGELMLEHLKGRPVSLVRAPSGVGGELFFQKHADTNKMPGVKQLDVSLDPGHGPMLEVATTGGLLSAAQWNVIELHTQNAYARDYERPNRMVFDLDPGKGVEWPAIQEAATLMRAFLDQLSLPAFLKTSGGKGLHVVVPIRPMYDWDTVKAFSQAIVAHMVATIPQRFVLKSGPKNRIGKIFIDYLRNGRGSTTVSAWSPRSRPGLGISVPIAWDELASVKGGDHWTVHTVHTRLDQGNAPWSGYANSAKSVTAAMKKLGFET